MSLPKILLVEDDRSITSALAHALKNTYDFDGAPSGKLAIYKTDMQMYLAFLFASNCANGVYGPRF
jgi:DNA-binding response OmpR family regulator